MNKITKKQLEQVSLANLSNFDAEHNVFYIKKYNKPIFKPNTYYIIRISRELINNDTHFIATNWNRGISPKSEYYKAYVSKTMGKMIYCDCLEYDYEHKQDKTNSFSGWFDINLIEQLEVIA